MVRLFVRHKVHDYAVWRKAYDAFKSTRIKFGVQAQAVSCNVDDGNDVTVSHEFNNVDAAKAFTNSGELTAAMKSAGVIGVPTVWITRRT